MASKNAGGREASLKNGEAVRQRKVNLGAIYNFAKPAFNEVIPAPKSPINNAGSTPAGVFPGWCVRLSTGWIIAIGGFCCGLICLCAPQPVSGR